MAEAGRVGESGTGELHATDNNAPRRPGVAAVGDGKRTLLLCLVARRYHIQEIRRKLYALVRNVVKAALYMFCTAVALLFIVPIALSYPWPRVIEMRLAHMNPSVMAAEYDAWRTSPTADPSDLGALPLSMRRLHPKRARVDSDGIYLEMGGFFVEEDGVFIALPGVDKSSEGAGSDPSYYPISPRVYRYHVSG